MMLLALLFVWTPAHNGVLQGIAIGLLTALVVMLARAMRRQRTIRDDKHATVSRALAKHATKARWTYFRRADGKTEFDWDDPDGAFPLDYRPGYLTGRTTDEMIPAGPEGDEARAVYAACVDDKVPGVYIRPEAAPDGRLVMVRFTHVPLGDGRGACEAVPLSPEIDAAVADRDRLKADNGRLRREVARLRQHYAQLTEQASAERTLRDALGTLDAGTDP